VKIPLCEFCPWCFLVSFKYLQLGGFCSSCGILVTLVFLFLYSV
jgi:hypothetical protein